MMRVWVSGVEGYLNSEPKCALLFQQWRSMPPRTHLSWIRTLHHPEALTVRLSTQIQSSDYLICEFSNDLVNLGAVSDR